MLPSFRLLLLAVPALVAQKIPDGPRGGGAVFTKCGGTLGFGGDICYEVTVSKLVVQVGPDGTNEDVTAKLCSDDKTSCCETDVLKSLLSDDWSPNDLENWGPRFFGACKDKRFKIQRGLELALDKKGTDTLGVQSIFIEADTINKDGKLETERYECGAYNIGGKAGINGTSSTSQSKFCKTSPYVYERVKQIKVTVGNDGTNDNVRVEVCSDVNDVCCRTPLSSLLADDWSKNDEEVWKESDLGDCKTMLYKVSAIGGPRFTLVKDGKDDLIVNKVIVDTEDVYGEKYQYDCGDFKLESQGQECVPGVNCSQTKVCKKSKVVAGAAAAAAAAAGATTTAPSTSTTRSERIATSTTAANSTTTTRPPFRSG